MKAFTLNILVIILFSCGASLEPPKSNSDFENIIGKPIVIENIKIAQFDFPKTMIWEDGKEACEALGQGWRLPNKEELNLLYKNKDKIKGFSNYNYWSSSESENDTLWGHWKQNFLDGIGLYGYDGVNTFMVRAVKSNMNYSRDNELRREDSVSNLRLKKDEYLSFIGNPIKIGNLEIAQFDLPNRLSYVDAKRVTKILGNDWKIPTIEQLKVIYQNRDNISNISSDNYWSRTESHNKQNCDYCRVWIYDFYSGNYHYSTKEGTCRVRLVRSL